MKILFKGITSNGLGDKSTHCVVQAGEHSALSIISHVHRADWMYGLPDVQMGKKATPEALVKAIEDKDPRFQILSVVPLKLLKDDEYPHLKPHAGTGLRTLTCSAGEMQDDTFATVASRIPELAEWLAKNEDKLRPDDSSSRSLSIAEMHADLERWGTQVVLDPESAPRCRADPHPAREPEEFVIDNLCKIVSNAPYRLGWPWPKDQKLARVDVSCQQGSSRLVITPVLEDDDG